jgi:multisubunit Na+/H+ antiporter MnhC subunit
MYSADGRWWWTGTEWVPAQLPAVQGTYLEETPWTRKLQIANVALLALGLVGTAIVFPLISNEIIGNATLRNPSVDSSDPQAVAAVQSVIQAFMVASFVLALAWLAVIVTGIVRLWRWVYWYLAIIYFLSVLSIPSDLNYTFGNGQIRLPTWVLLIQLPTLLVEVGLAIWMVIAFRRYGTWARRKVSRTF